MTNKKDASPVRGAGDIHQNLCRTLKRDNFYSMTEVINPSASPCKAISTGSGGIALLFPETAEKAVIRAETLQDVVFFQNTAFIGPDIELKATKAVFYVRKGSTRYYMQRGELTDLCTGKTQARYMRRIFGPGGR